VFSPHCLGMIFMEEIEATRSGTLFLRVVICLFYFLEKTRDGIAGRWHFKKLFILLSNITGHST